MTRVRIRLNSAGVRDLLRSLEPDLAARAARIARAAGPGFESSSTSGRNRALAQVWAETPEAMRAEAKDRALTRAIDAGRG